MTPLCSAKTRRRATYPHATLFRLRIIDWHWRRPPSRVHLRPRPLTTQSTSARAPPAEISRRETVHLNRARCSRAWRRRSGQLALGSPERRAGAAARVVCRPHLSSHTHDGKIHEADPPHVRGGPPFPVRGLQTKQPSRFAPCAENPAPRTPRSMLCSAWCRLKDIGWLFISQALGTPHRPHQH